MTKRLVPVLLAMVPALALAQATTWNLDPVHTQTTFGVRHLVISTVRGEFKKTSGVVMLDEQDPTKSSVEATIDATTINTREDKRDADLKSPNFLDVQKYPTITFKSTKVVKDGDRYKVTGDLTIHGVTKPAVLDATLSPEVKDPWGGTRRGIQASTKINRQDYGLHYSKAIEAGPVVGDEVAIEINAEIVKAAGGQKAASAR
ncbi:YceI family protein [Anaeromyxobacter oryzae]|uniref:Polyisoprenoid-binding protein n=1 Tax=Anaeromyxobacter oryzae TaxID=2918170 RepID=A0ABM7WTH1_9BACT|nr:YceI family protein [Anaeromyxobacter oryzae]BDG02768.1 polyisoprenoid-binding protein [Anaeromyxobacter oryzae]